MQRTLLHKRVIVQFGKSIFGTAMDLASYEFGAHAVDRAVIGRLAEQFADNNIRSPLTVDAAVAQKHRGVVVFKNAQDYISTLDGHSRVPDTPDHFLKHLGLTSSAQVGQYVKDQVKQDHDSNCVTPPDQISRKFSRAYKLKNSLTKGVSTTYFEEQEFFLQVGYRHSPGHYDHGHVLAFMPRFCRDAVKLWISVPFDKLGVQFKFDSDSFMRMARHPHTTLVIQEPGDVVYQAPLSYHTVLLGYRKNTPDELKWCLLGGTVFTQATDMYDAYVYATRAVAGVRKGTNESWGRVLWPFYQLSRRGSYDLKKEKEIFMKKLAQDPRFNQANRASVLARWDKRSKKKQKIDNMNALKEAKRGNTS